LFLELKNNDIVFAWCKKYQPFFLALEIASTFLHCDRNWLLP